MYFERILIANAQARPWAEHNFAAGPGRLRRWNRLPLGAPASRLLRALAIAGLGRRQMDRFRAFFPMAVFRQVDPPVHIEVIQVRHAPQERRPASPARRQVGWRLGRDGWFEPLPKSRMLLPESTAAKGLPEPGRSNNGRLLVAYGATVRSLTGRDGFDILPTQRLRRCASLFDSRSELTSPLAFLSRLRFKGKYRAGRARALLAKLAVDLSRWMDWDVAARLEEEAQFEALWKATPRSRRAAAVLALDIARHAYDASPGLEDIDAFCVVPAKEGAPRQVSDLDTLLQGRRKLILLDDNLLAHPAGLGLLEEMARRDLEVNFNQTLDLRLLTRESAALLRRIRCANAIFSRRVYHFSLNDARHRDRVRERYALLRTTSRDNAEFICMYGFNTSLEEDVRRFRFLRTLPGAYVFVQRYSDG